MQASVNQGGSSQMNGLPQHHQVHNPATHGMDPELETMRSAMREKIREVLEKNSTSSEWKSRIPGVVKLLEERMFKESANKSDYYNKLNGSIEHQLSSMSKSSRQPNQSMSHHITSSSTFGTMMPTPGTTMIPTPGIAQCASGNSRISVDSTTLATGSAGSISNGYQQSNNVTVNSAVSGVASSMASLGMQQQVPHMIPTPGFHNQQNLPVNTEYSNGAGYFNGESNLAQHQKQYTGNQNSNTLQYLGGQVLSGVHSSMPQNSSAYGLSDGLMNGGMGLHASNTQLVNGPAASEGYINVSQYGSSPKPLQQQFSQHPQQRIPTSVDMVGAGTFYSAGSSVLSAANNLNMTGSNLQPKSRTNPTLLNHQSNLQSSQARHQTKNQMLDHQEKANFQSSLLPPEQLLRSQQTAQQTQIQPQIHNHLVQSQYNIQRPQQNSQQQPVMLRSNSIRQSQLPPSHAEAVMPEHALLSNNELITSHATEYAGLSDIHSHYQQRGSYDNGKGGQLFGHLSGSQNFHLSNSHDSQPLLSPHQKSEEALNEVGYIFRGSQSDSLMQPQWRSQQTEKVSIVDSPSLKNRTQEDFRQRSMGHEEAQQPFTTDWRPTGSAVPSCDLTKPKHATNGSDDSTGGIYLLRQLRLLLLLFHVKICRGCNTTSGCQPNGQNLRKHIASCKSRKDCLYPYCWESKQLMDHDHLCPNKTTCSLCIKVAARTKHIVSNGADPEPRAVAQQNLPQEIMNGVEGDKMEIDPVSVETFDMQQSLQKRLKIHQPGSPVVSESEISPVPDSLSKEMFLQERRSELPEQKNKAFGPKREIDVRGDLRPAQGKSFSIGYVVDGNASMERHNVVPGVSNEFGSNIKQESMEVDRETMGTNHEVKHEITDGTSNKSGKPKIKGVSLMELFTPEQINQHIASLRQWVGQSKAKAEKNQAMESSMSENSCQLCAVEKLTFEPPPIYCSPCGARIKRNAMYYTGGTGDTRHYFCIPCFNESRGDSIEVEGHLFLKTKLEKKKNDEETEEWWVQCDKCEAWQHQICALFNGRRNDGGEAEYTCPNCYVQEVRKGERMPLPQTAVLGAKDLPKTILSDHIENRLFKRLKQERQDRANHFGKSFEEVPGAEGLVVRVVSSVDKKLDVKPRFLEIFQENYPTEFSYKSKAVLLFQKIEGVEVCLFGMYVQEFGSECALPNQRRVYLSYLDSVKYFRPEIRTVSGEALRTFVYHEILIGYLEYCKQRGFTSCYIWACPPLKGEDYILYCHPEIQKTPKSDKLREWYLAMLRKAAKEEIVVELTNLYDHFFLTMGECKAKVTAARLPYFDGDYWPGAAEDMINQLRQEEDDRKQQKKGKTKKTITKRALKAAGHTDLSGNASKDAMLMQKLGETIYPMKEDFIMVHLQYSCTRCCMLLASGRRWVCNQCKNFYICDVCHDLEQRREDRDRHPSNSRDVHTLHPVEIVGVPEDTKDKDEILESEFFDTRQAFLSLCQGNHYQYDTLRRAKHSSMMVLYHLHNPTAPAFVTTCNVCRHDIEAGQGWRCETCPDFDVCTSCYQKEGGINHPHPLTNQVADRDAQNKEARQKRVLQLRKMLDLLVHASMCRNPHCQYPNCRKVKGLFRHGIQCKTRASGGCVLCKKMWYILQLHARACKESECNVPRCKDLKEHLRRLQQQSDSRRRAAVNEMMRQRAAEVAGNNE